MTGAPGVGKSTLVSGLISTVREQGRTAAVIGSGPVEPPDGLGAILGDRIRMQEHADDPGVYIRSMGRARTPGGPLGGDAPGRRSAGRGRFRRDPHRDGRGGGRRRWRSCTTPTHGGGGHSGLGGQHPGGQAGLMEIGDVFAVNKAELPGAVRARRDLETMLAMGPRRPWTPPVVETRSRVRDGSGQSVGGPGRPRRPPGERHLITRSQRRDARPLPGPTRST